MVWIVRFFWAVLIACCSAVVLGHDDPEAHNTAVHAQYTGMQLEAQTSHGDSIAVFVKTKKVSESDSSKADKVWGTGRNAPADTVIEALKVTINNKAVVIPSKAYIDLSNLTIPKGFYAKEKGSEIQLQLRGGDGKNGYTAYFIIVDGKLTQRKIAYFDHKGSKAFVDTDFDN